ncbi:DUF1499 domain-containing protein [Rhizobiaceae bacterium]|nr:DUF1499 domain-containing protein [Rhizobiaceae bacterium]
MIWITRLLAFLLGFAAVVVIVYAIALNYGFERVWSRVAGPADLGDTTFRGYAKGTKPNEALVCPPNLCAETSVDLASPVYAVPVSRLRDALLESLEIEPRLERVDDDSDSLRLRFIQRSKTLLFPDTISIELIPVTDETSTLALHSRSQIGTSDLGVNRTRAERWLDRLGVFEVDR